jgi:hypothetical protein
MISICISGLTALFRLCSNRLRFEGNKLLRTEDNRLPFGRSEKNVSPEWKVPESALLLLKENRFTGAG